MAAANSLLELRQIEAEWSDRYGKVPNPAQQLLKVAELKQIAKPLGFSRIKTEGKQNIILETPMQKPAWESLKEKLPSHLQSRFIYTSKKVMVKGLGTLKTSQQLDNLTKWLGYLTNSN